MVELEFKFRFYVFSNCDRECIWCLYLFLVLIIVVGFSINNSYRIGFVWENSEKFVMLRVERL